MSAKNGVPLWVVDGLVDVTDDVGSLAEAVECAHVAAQTSITDPMEFMEGTLAVLLLAAEEAHVKAAKMRNKAERMLA